MTNISARPKLSSRDYVAARVEQVQAVDGFTPCWEWQGKLRDGYGKAVHAGASMAAHRFAYAIYVGPIPDGFQVDHLCFNRCCVNPDHLEAVTGAENMRRAIANGLAKGTGNWAKKDLCAKGLHEMREGNFRIVKSRGYDARLCIACREVTSRNAYMTSNGLVSVALNSKRKGEGSVFQRKDGKWVAEYPLPPENGKRRSKLKYAKSKEAAEVALRELRESLSRA